MSESNGSRRTVRRPVFADGRRVSGLFERTRKDGSRTFEFNGRLDGTMKRVRLKAPPGQRRYSRHAPFRSTCGGES